MSLKPIIAAVNKEGTNDAKQKKIAELNKKIKNVKKQIDAIKMANAVKKQNIAQKYTIKEEKELLGGGGDPNRAVAMQRGLERATEAMRQKKPESKPKTPISTFQDFLDFLELPPDIFQNILNSMDNYYDILDLIVTVLIVKKRTADPAKKITGKFDRVLAALYNKKEEMILSNSKFYEKLKTIYAQRAPKIATYEISKFNTEVVNHMKNEKDERKLIKARFEQFIIKILRKNPSDYNVGDWFVYDTNKGGILEPDVFLSCNGLILMPHGKLFDISIFNTIITSHNIIPCIPAEVIPDEVNATKKLINVLGYTDEPYIAFEFDAKNKYAMEEFENEYEGRPNIKPFVFCIYRMGYGSPGISDGAIEYLFYWGNKDDNSRYLAIHSAAEPEPSGFNEPPPPSGGRSRRM